MSRRTTVESQSIDNKHCSVSWCRRRHMNLSIGSEKFESQINAYKAFVNRQKTRQMDCSVSFHFWKYLINQMKNMVFCLEEMGFPSSAKSTNKNIVTILKKITSSWHAVAMTHTAKSSRLQGEPITTESTHWKLENEITAVAGVSLIQEQRTLRFVDLHQLLLLSSPVLFNHVIYFSKTIKLDLC